VRRRSTSANRGHIIILQDPFRHRWQ